MEAEEIVQYPEIDINKLIPHPDNSKEHDQEQIVDIAESIKGNGFGRPLIISSDYYILAGEGAWLACKNILKLKTVPYKFLEPRRKHDEPEAISYMLADNKFAERSTWNHSKVGNNLDFLRLKRFNTRLAGFDSTDLKALDSNLKPMGNGSGELSGNGNNKGESPEEFPEVPDDIDTDYHCPKCGYEWSGKPK